MNNAAIALPADWRTALATPAYPSTQLGQRPIDMENTSAPPGHPKRGNAPGPRNTGANQESKDNAPENLPDVQVLRAPGPAPLTIFNPEKIPQFLKDQNRWAPWRAVWNVKRQKFDKIPASFAAPYYGISTAKPDQWGTFDQAFSAHTDNPGVFGGLGYVMTGEHDVVGIDLDNCVVLDDNHIEPWALEVIDRLGSYTELSPSGKGLRIMAHGVAPNDWTNHEVGIEVYSGHEPRFLTITGQRLRASVSDIVRPAASVLGDLAAQYAKVKTAATAITLELPDILDDMVLPSLDSLPLPTSVQAFLTLGDHGGDRSRALFAASVGLYNAGLNDEEVFSILALNPFAFEVALDHRRQDSDRALMYLWVEHCQKGKAKSTPVASLADFEDLTLTPVSPAQIAEQVAIVARNRGKAEQIAQAAIDKAMAPTVTDILCTIANNDLIGDSPSELVNTVLAGLVKSQFAKVEDESILKRLKDATGFSLVALRGDLAKARRKGPDDRVACVSADWPVPTARVLVQERYSVRGEVAIRRWQDEFLTWDGMRYQPVSSEDVRAMVYELFDIHQVELANRAPVDNTLDALKAQVNVPSTLSMPGWLSGEPPAPVKELIVVRNGLLHVPSQTLFDHDPRFFTAGSVDVEFSPGAQQPVKWLAFLDAAFPTDQESIDALQQWFGYLLTQDTSQQKGLICVGPKRCGKGTIARVLRALLGEHNCTGPTLGQLSQQFGMQDLIGKSLALISDARVSGSADLQSISENVLRVTGEDAITVPRKHKTDWVGKLTTRFVLLTNILPGIVDAGGAVGSRFIVLKFTESFYGREDTRLTDKLLAELPGILNWALAGLQALQKRGAFTQPATGLAAVEELIRRTTPILGFVADSLVIDAGHWVSKDALYEHYKRWCHGEGMKFTNQKNSFFSELYANSDGRLESFEIRVKGSTRRVKAVRGARFADGVADQVQTLAGDAEGILNA